MSATNGSLFRRVAVCLAAVFALSAILATAASAKPIPKVQSQLSLGDSLAFGYSAQKFNENFPAESPAAFEQGYVNKYNLRHKPDLEGIQLQDLGCPGETTDSMIGNGPLGSVLDPTEGESPCAYHKAGFPLHDEYGGGKSQLEAALEQSAIDFFTGTPVTHITFNIGANDELHQIAKCEAEAVPTEEAAFFGAYVSTLEKGGTEAEALAAGKKAAEIAGKAYVKSCIEAHVTGLFGHILKNIGSIMFTLRHGSLFGGVDYSGPVAFLGGYDPYGAVFVPAEELLQGSNALASILNFHENKLLTDTGTEAAEEGHEPFGACFYNPQPYFNPGTKAEPNRLKALTNMANFTVTGGKNYGEPGADGPDIHPTFEGYNYLGNTMFLTCG